jgi:hypothetical protein
MVMQKKVHIKHGCFLVPGVLVDLGSMWIKIYKHCVAFQWFVKKKMNHSGPNWDPCKSVFPCY